MTTTPEYLQRDQAISPQDQAVLAQIRQAVFPQGQTKPWMSSVHFILKDGAVRLVGTVPATQDRERIEEIVRQVPGVTRIYDALAVNPSASVASTPAATSNQTAGATPAPVLPPTSYPATNAAGSNSSASPLTNSVYENPPVQNPRQ